MRDLIHVSCGHSDIRLIGGKAKNLDRLSQAGINVPCWLSITVRFFEEFMGDDIKKIDTLLKPGDLKGKKLAKQCAAIQHLILSKRFSPAMKAVIEENLSKHFGDYSRIYFSVRSSAVDEDSLRHSFAGQLESFLYVRFGEELYLAIKKCFASAFSERVMSYRVNNRIPLVGVRPAVMETIRRFGLADAIGRENIFPAGEKAFTSAQRAVRRARELLNRSIDTSQLRPSDLVEEIDFQI